MPTYAQLAQENAAQQPPAHIARLSVHYTPGPPVSADLVIPATRTSQNGHSPGRNGGAKPAAQDLPSRFPVHEEYDAPFTNKGIESIARR